MSVVRRIVQLVVRPLTRAVNAALGVAGFTPIHLFSNGEQGVWYDVNDLTTLYQDSTGITPCSTPGQGVAMPVGLMLDKSGNGNHASQSTSASRPALSGRYNLLTYTEQFDNAAWGKVGTGGSPAVSVSANQATAPDGTLTADKLIAGTSAGTHYIQQTISAYTAATFSIYAKAAEASKVRLALFSSGVVATFDLSAETATGATDASIEPVGDGWYRCAFSAIGASNTLVQIYTGDNNAGNGTDGIYIWGADLRVTNDSLNIPEYQRVVDALTYDTTGFPLYLSCDGVDDGMVTNSIDFSTVTSDGQARRNLLTYPSAFDNAAWTKSETTIAANAVVAPDGTTTADALIENTASGQHKIRSSATVLSSTTYTFSVYVKAAGRTLFSLYPQSGTTASANFNLSTGSSANGDTVTNLVGHSITPVGDGWYRCSIVFTTTGTTVLPHLYLMQSAGTSAPTYTGDGSSGIYIWGAQLETGTSATDFQDIGTDKIFVAAGVRKLSDAAVGILAELSADTNSNNGSFYLAGPISTVSKKQSFATRGSITVNATEGAAAPISSILGGLGDISGDSAVLRLNGVEAASSTSDQGTGTYGNYPLYLFRRGGSSLPYNGRFYNLVVRGGALPSDTQVAQVETYLNRTTQAY